MGAGAEPSQSRGSPAACPGAQGGLPVCPRDPLLRVRKVLYRCHHSLLDPDLGKVEGTSLQEAKLEWVS